MAGPATAVKALRAVLNHGKVGFELRCASYIHPFGAMDRFRRDTNGYRSYSQALGLNSWHMVLVTKRPGFLASVDEETIWRELCSPRFTTPILRAWTPYLLERLKEGYWSRRTGRGNAGIIEADAWGCSPGILVADDAKLDKFVTEGLKQGSISI